MHLLQLPAGELDVVDAVAALEDHRVDGGVVRHAERIGVRDGTGGAGAGAAPASPGAGCQGAAQRDQHGHGQSSAEEAASFQWLILNVHCYLPSLGGAIDW